MSGRDRLPVLLFGALTVLIVVFRGTTLAIAPDEAGERIASDWAVLVEAGRRVLDGGAFYPARQLAGPFDAYAGAVLYPPIAIPFVVAVALVPWPLWWGIPLGIGLAGVARWRPAPWTWPLLVILALFHQTIWLVLSGNPAMWGFAALAWWPRGWPVLYFALKPSLGPFALLGIRRRSWWIGLGALAFAGLVFLPLWPEWLATIGNAQTHGSTLLYSSLDVPFMLLPLVAWAGRLRPAHAPDRPSP